MSKYEEFTAIAVNVEDRIAVLSLNLPDTGNAFNGAMHDELAEAFYRLNEDTDVSVIILTGAGGEFCTGGDVTHILELTPAQYDAEFLTVRRLMSNILSLDKPLIGAINGSAIGVGATVALSCDLIIVAEDALISDPHVTFGLAAGDGGALMWALAAGLPAAKYHLLTGEPVSARTALDLRLINEVVPREAVLARSRELAVRLVNSPGQAIRGTKRILNKIASVVAAGVLDMAAEIERQTLHSADHHEAIAASLEGRPPVWTDR